MSKHKQEEQRTLSKAEMKRKAAFEQVKKELQEAGYQEHDLTVGLVYANVMALAAGIPLILLFEIAFFRRNQQLSGTIDGAQIVLFFVLFFALICVHELIHGICWAVFAQNHWKAISFGFIAKYVTPYCTCSEPLDKVQYIIGGLMPTILLGIIPSLAAIYTGSAFLLLLGAAMILGGGGDILIVAKLLRHHSKSGDTVYMDHPYQAGVVAFVRE